MSDNQRQTRSEDDTQRQIWGDMGRLSRGGELPSYHKRAFAHNYYAPFIYHIILKKAAGFENFGEAMGDARIAPGQPGCAFIQESEIGKVLAKEIFKIQKIFPIIQVYQFKVMPDHAHILLRVKEWSEYHLDHYIETLCNNVAHAYSAVLHRDVSAEDIFVPGYCDKPLLLARSLDGLYKYIRENPHRLVMRMQFPQFFQRVRAIRIAYSECEAYGNLFLLRNPDKSAVKISSKYTPVEKEKKISKWLYAAERGTILVSPFISNEEKNVRAKAEALGAKIILLTHKAFPDRYKPANHDFDLCAEGRLLIVSLCLPPKIPLTREICQRMNALASAIAGEHPKTNP